MFTTDHVHNGPRSQQTTFITDHVHDRPLHYRTFIIDHIHNRPCS